MFLYLCYVCGGSSQRLQSSVELEIHLAVGCLIWVLGTKPGLLEGQQTLSAGELSLQPKKESFYDKDSHFKGSLYLRKLGIFALACANSVACSFVYGSFGETSTSQAASCRSAVSG